MVSPTKQLIPEILRVDSSRRSYNEWNSYVILEFNTSPRTENGIMNGQTDFYFSLNGPESANASPNLSVLQQYSPIHHSSLHP